MLLKLKQNNFYYKDNAGIINDYYQMIVELIKKFLYDNSKNSINITLCNNHYNFVYELSGKNEIPNITDEIRQNWIEFYTKNKN